MSTTIYSLQCCCISTILFLTLGTICKGVNENRKPYIVYMGSLPRGEYSPSAHHLRMLRHVIGNSVGTNVLIRSYQRSFNGFAALLTDQERQKLTDMEGVVSVFPSTSLQLLTTRSWDFMGFRENTSRNPSVESDVIVGLLDSGIWPESESFQDDNLGPAPKKWKGGCKGGTNFTCNKKLIGARYYVADTDGNESARDVVGHGSHTASTAGGNKVKDASFYDIGKGMARGGVPSARIAMYKVCSNSGCDSDALLAGFDDAIADGVDLISISIGGSFPAEFPNDVIAIGAFHAMEKGILTIHSAGNSGPEPGSVVSVAPWLLTAAANSIDRQFIDEIVLADGRTFTGRSINSFTLNEKSYPLIYGKDATKDCHEYSARNCDTGCLDKDLVKGKIVLCDSYRGKSEAFASNASGMITQAQRLSDVSFVVELPIATLSPEDYDAIKKYMNSNNPRATIHKTISSNDLSAPAIASFSSRGPNTIVPDILKPDVTAPGIDILAAYSPVVSPSGNENDKRSVKYSILSGTSMSCPHVAGAAGHIKSLHPNWSSSAIKSALMTTARPLTKKSNPDGEFGHGSGQIDPLKAANPGLVYESSKEDYIKLLCSMGFDDKKIRLISGDNSSCPQEKSSARNLNYPSMTAKVEEDQSFEVSFERVVTNVGLPNSTYKLKPRSNAHHNPEELIIKVVPENLSFSSLNEKKSFKVTVSGSRIQPETTLSESLAWTDGVHFVRSPILCIHHQHEEPHSISAADVR